MSDLISRTAFKNKYLCFGYLPEMSEKEFDRFPTVDAEPVVHGHWIYDEATGEVRCNHCNAIVAVTMCKVDLNMILADENFCFRCGAKMDEVADEET